VFSGYLKQFDELARYLEHHNTGRGLYHLQDEKKGIDTNAIRRFVVDVFVVVVVVYLALH